MADHGDFREEFHDEHPHSYDHSEPKGSLLFVFFGVAVVLVALSGIAVQFLYDYWIQQEVYNRVLVPENVQLRDLRTTEDRELHSFGYADKATGKVRITVDRAMELVANDAREGRAAYPTAPYAVKVDDPAATGTPPVSQPGAAAANNASNQGTGSNPNVHQPSTPHR